MSNNIDFVERKGSFRFSTNSENEVNQHDIPPDVWSINCGQKEPSSSVHAGFVPPLGEIISLLPLAYRLR
jgi:hypothetical protein